MWVLILSGLSFLQGSEPIATDRPDFTETSYVISKNSVQVETGFTHLRDRDFKATSGPEALIRIGQTDRMELRLGLPDYVWIEGGLEGFDDASFGAKIQLGPLKDGTGLAIIPAVSIPIGREGIRSESWSPELKICWSRDLGENSLSGMLAVSSVEESGSRQTLGQHTLSYGFSVGPQTGMFVEHVLDLSKNSRPQHTLHSGFAHQPSPDRQWDLHFGFGLTSNASDSFVGLGYSFRFDSRS